MRLRSALLLFSLLSGALAFAQPPAAPRSEPEPTAEAAGTVPEPPRGPDERPEGTAPSAPSAMLETESDGPTDAAGEEGADVPQTAPSMPSPARGDYGSYALDALPRLVPARGRLRCPTEDVVTYSGSVLRYGAPMRVHRDFVPFLRRFEEIVAEVARATYGRAPHHISHRGAFNCRRIRGVPTVLSEHAFGNAIDVKGFDFYGAGTNDPMPTEAPAAFRRSFRVRILDHWNVDYGDRAYHQVFFERLRQRLLEDTSLFGVILGPSYPGHRDHLHLDRAPFRFVQF